VYISHVLCVSFQFFVCASSNVSLNSWQTSISAWVSFSMGAETVCFEKFVVYPIWTFGCGLRFSCKTDVYCLKIDGFSVMVREKTSYIFTDFPLWYLKCMTIFGSVFLGNILKNIEFPQSNAKDWQKVESLFASSTSLSPIAIGQNILCVLRIGVHKPGALI